jgi:acyl-CoA reductase-like NAD-dependent aldehyde dehydrogenase
MTPPFHDESARARTAQRLWADTPIRSRLKAVREFRHLLVERCDAITAAVAADLGRPPGEVIATDVLPTAAAAKFLERHAERILKPRKVGWRPMWLMGCRDVVYRRPHGVVGVIGTWNYPLFLNAVPVLHAVAAGNAVLWKPSENAPQFAAVLTTLLRDAGFPPDLIVPLPATREAGPLLAEADVDFVHFTGSDPVGRKLAARLGERLIPSALELSGCDALFVLDDADVELAARAAWYGATLNRGRTCMAVRRAFVQRGVWEGFVRSIVPLAPGGEGLGVRGQTSGGLMLNPAPDHPALHESTFATRLAVVPFDTLDDALRLHAECNFRLTASVFTRDTAAARDLAARLPVGCVTINDVIVPTAHPGTPFGGRRSSGWGVTQGDEGLLQMTVPQAVTVRSGKFRPHIDTELNADPAGGDVTAGMLRMTHGRTLGQRWRGLWMMVSGTRRFGKLPPSPPGERGAKNYGVSTVIAMTIGADTSVPLISSICLMAASVRFGVTVRYRTCWRPRISNANFDSGTSTLRM